MTSSSDTKKDLKPVKTKLRLKKDDIRQCRLCMRVLPRTDIRDATANGSDLRRKILDAVSVKITSYDKVTSVCINCITVVDTIYNFRSSCRKADTLHGTRLLMMHPGRWLSDENKSTLEACHKLIKRNRAEMDALFKCSGLDDGNVNQLMQAKTQEVLLETKDESGKKTEDVSDSDPEMSEQCGKKLDEEVEKAAPIVRRRFVPVRNKAQMCEICGELVPMAKLEDHTNRHLDDKPYHCSEEGCGKTFFSLTTKNSHIRTVHSEKKHKWYSCPLCSKKLRGIAVLRKHMYIHKDNRSNPHKVACSICGKGFYKCYIKDHMAVHTGELPYGCEFCDRRFAAKQNINNHRKKYHSNELNQQMS
ncbi:zinc finger protein 732-like [Ochlerotatus camptorhynchus]|uniref:zinc finger protein 732-like n=1 Tax=Ochlerotatus camptorhynchus TaxID=644619 RepID=UPI0031DE1562